jgi:hypothetical protein
MKFFRSPKSYPYIVVAVASLIMMSLLVSGERVSVDFPLILFISAKVSVIFGAVEIGLSMIGRYDSSEQVYKSISRAINAFGMAVCFMLLIGAFEAAR